MSWDPSVRTRHLTVIILLTVAAVAALLAFSLLRLLSAQLVARHKTVETLADQFFQIAQETIHSRPSEEPQLAISENHAVVSLIRASTGERKDLAYCAVVAADGRIITASDPRDLRRLHHLLKPIEELERARWYKQLWQLWRSNGIYELKTPIQLSNRPFVDMIAGVPAGALRAELWPTIKLSLIFAGIIAGIGLLTAVLTSNLVLRPLREVVTTIEQLEAESVAQGPAAQHAEQVSEMKIAQRIRELGRRFAGNRTEIEAIRDQLQKVIGNLTERVLLLDREQRVIMASPEAERLLSHGDFTLRGQRLTDALSRAHPLSQLTERAFTTRRSLQEMASFPGNGVGRPHTILASLQLFEDRGQPAGALLTLRDFETIQRLETQLDFATKLAALNRITAGVAHEVKNPLHAMVLHLELLHAKLDAGLDPKPHVDILSSEVNRLKRVVQTFLDFTRPVELKLYEVDVNTLVREVTLLAADARAQGIDLTEEYGAGPLTIKADADMIKQVLLNIILNGCQVMPDGGKLTLRTGRLNENGQEIVFIAVADTGPGIPDDVRDKIFNLYYTTKPKGSGIGLAQAFRAVQLHNGRIKVETEIGCGTCFRIELPAA